MSNRGDWREKRERVLDRDGDRCKFCEASTSASLEIHHIIPRRDGGGDEMWNLITVCRPCHELLESLTRKIIDGIAMRDGEDSKDGSVKISSNPKRSEMQTTTIQLKTDTWREINSRKGPGESIDDVIRRDGLETDSAE